MSSRLMPPPLADAVIWTFPVAGDGAVTVTDEFDWATANDALRSQHIKHKAIEMIVRKGVLLAEAHAPATNSPSFGSSAIRRCSSPDPWLCVPASRRVCLFRKGSPLLGPRRQGRCHGWHADPR